MLRVKSRRGRLELFYKLVFLDFPVFITPVSGYLCFLRMAKIEITCFVKDYAERSYDKMVIIAREWRVFISLSLMNYGPAGV